MTLDEAIKRAEEVAEMKKTLSEESELQGCSMYAIRCGKSAEEHRQLAAWLRELKRLKEKEEPRTVRYKSDTVAHCPRCNYTFELLHESWENEFHCPNCGQRLRWEE